MLRPYMLDTVGMDTLYGMDRYCSIESFETHVHEDIQVMEPELVSSMLTTT